MSVHRNKKILLFGWLFIGHMTAYAANLVEVYQQAQTSDALYQQAISQRLATKEGVPISLSALLPNIAVTGTPSITRTGVAGTYYADTVGGDVYSPRNTTTRAYTLTLSATQTIFNFQQFTAVAGSVATAKGADATLNAAMQDLMVRVTKAYLAVLEAEDNLRYSEASKQAFKEQLEQAQHQYEVGLKTITDVYTAKASYESSVANYIAAEAAVANNRENLRVITGQYYAYLSPLSESFELISPNPADAETWVKQSILQNWNIKSAQFNTETALQNIRQQFGGHLPTVSLEGSLQRAYSNNINNYDSLNQRNGPGTQTNKTVMLNIGVPIFEGGGVVAQTNQATYNYDVARQQLEQTVRETANAARQSYLNIIAGISKIKADREAIKSNISSLEGMEASYSVGTETLVNVLNQQQKLYESQVEYARDRYAYVNNFLALKQAAGTLSFDDLRAINARLVEQNEVELSTLIRKPKAYNKPEKLTKRKAHLPAAAKKPAKPVSTAKHKPAKHSAVKRLAKK